MIKNNKYNMKFLKKINNNPISGYIEFDSHNVPYKGIFKRNDGINSTINPLYARWCRITLHRVYYMMRLHYNTDSASEEYLTFLF